MSGKIFLDTNILIYAYDRSEPEKQAKSLHILEQLAMTQSGVISTQVLAEFFNASTRKLPTPLTPTESYKRIENFLSVWQILDTTGMTVLEAARGVRDYQFSFWDSMIWASARMNQISLVFSEDFNIGANIEGIRFVNPLADDFTLDAWL